MGLDSVEIVVNTEKYFNIAIPDAEAAEIVTVQDLADCAFRHLNGNPAWSKPAVEKIVLDILSDCTGIPVTEIKLEHSITRDLGVD